MNFLRRIFPKISTMRAFPRRTAALECSAPFGEKLLRGCHSPVTRIIQETHLRSDARGAREGSAISTTSAINFLDRCHGPAVPRLTLFFRRPFPTRGACSRSFPSSGSNLLADIIPNHVLSATEFPAAFNTFREELGGRSMVVRKKLSRFPSNASCVATFPAPAGKTTNPREKSAALRSPPACANRIV